MRLPGESLGDRSCMSLDRIIVPAALKASTVEPALDWVTKSSLLPLVIKTDVALPWGELFVFCASINCWGSNAAATATQLPNLAMSLHANEICD